MGYNLHLEEQEMKTAFQKVIGVTPLYDEERDSYWMLPGYMKMLEAENAIPMMLPPDSERGGAGLFSRNMRRISGDRRAGCVPIDLSCQKGSLVWPILRTAG